MTRRLLRLILAALSGALGLVLCLQLAAQASLAAEPASPGAPASAAGDFGHLDATVALTGNCRYGVAGSQPYINWIASQNLNIGWNLDFDFNPTGTQIAGSEYINIVFSTQDKDAGGKYFSSYTFAPPLSDTGLGAIIAAERGALWLAGNEPDRGPNVLTDTNRVQGDTYPEVYARIYHDLYQYIKAHDPTAQVANAGLVEVTPGRLQYLDKVWDTYLSLYGQPMPVDVWNMHLYVLPEAIHDGSAPDEIASIARGSDLSLAQKESAFITGDTQWCGKPGYTCLADHDDMKAFAAQVTAMRTWLKNHGQQNKPLIISEYGQLYPCLFCENLTNPADCFPRDEFGRCFTPARTAAFLTNSFAYLNSAADPAIGDPWDDNRLVQQWLWFSLNTPGFANSNLVTASVPLTFTPAGEALRVVAALMPAGPNLFAADARRVALQRQGDTLIESVQIEVVNNGTRPPPVPVSVTVYDDPARRRALGSATLAPLPGCARRESSISLSWSLPANVLGAVNYYVVVDPENTAGESNLNDNLITITLVPNPAASFVR